MDESLKIPKSEQKQIELLEKATYELVEWLMNELGWDNPWSIIDTLSDDVHRIASRAYENNNS